jgi:uncharacterized repeat protein (TIGR01451 family)
MCAPLVTGLVGDQRGTRMHQRELGGGDVMSKQNVIKRWMPVIALALLPSLFTLVVQAAPPPAPLLGFTPTPVPSPTVTVIAPSLSDCDPELSKQVSPSIAQAGDPVTFTIKVTNRGQQATVNGRVQDTVPDHLEILEIETLDEHKGLQVHPVSGQTVLVDTGILGQDAELTILIHTKARPIEVAPAEGDAEKAQDPPTPVPICVQNVAHFTADNCPSRRAEAAPCLLPATGTPDTKTWWMLAAGLATGVLVLSLALSRKWRTRASPQA